MFSVECVPSAILFFFSTQFWSVDVDGVRAASYITVNTRPSGVLSYGGDGLASMFELVATNLDDL